MRSLHNTNVSYRMVNTAPSNKNIPEDIVQDEQEEEIFDRKLHAATSDLRRFYHNILVERVPRQNAQVIIDYILAMKTETNISDNYRVLLLWL